MDQQAPSPRPWTEVAREQRYTFKSLGRVVGRAPDTMLQYSGGFRRIPKDVLDKLSEFFGVPVK